MDCRIIDIEGHEVLQPYYPCPDCGEDMQSVVFGGLICWNCYDKKHEEQSRSIRANDD